VTFEIGNFRPIRLNELGPKITRKWPVLVDGKEVAEIVETERGYRLRENGQWIAPERPFRAQVEEDAWEKYGEKDVDY